MNASLQNRRAFTLIEVCLAVGIFGFAVVGILGLFPVAMKSASESQSLTYSTQIAESIFATAKGSPFDSTAVEFAKNPPGNIKRFDLRSPTASQLSVVYSFDGTPIREATSQEFDSGTPDPLGAYLASVSFRPKASGIAYMIVKVEHPSAAPQSKRTSQVFTTLVAKQD